MKTTTTVALMGITVAIAVGIVGVNTLPEVDSEIPKLSSTTMGIYGHAEFVVRDSGGNIIAYSQSDNAIINYGLDCAARFLFHNNTADTDIACNDSEQTTGTDGFRHIAIGNTTGVQGTLDQTATRASQFPSANEITEGNWRVAATPDFAAATGSTGTTVTISSGAQTIDDTVGSTNVTRSALFDAATGDNVAAIINIPGGVSVNDGDSLTVTWTITVG